MLTQLVGSLCAKAYGGYALGLHKRARHKDSSRRLRRFPSKVAVCCVVAAFCWGDTQLTAHNAPPAIARALLMWIVVTSEGEH